MVHAKSAGHQNFPSIDMTLIFYHSIHLRRLHLLLAFVRHQNDAPRDASRAVGDVSGEAAARCELPHNDDNSSLSARWRLRPTSSHGGRLPVYRGVRTVHGRQALSMLATRVSCSDISAFASAHCVPEAIDVGSEH